MSQNCFFDDDDGDDDGDDGHDDDDDDDGDDDIDDDDDANAVGGNMLVQVQETSGWRLCATCARTLRNNMCKDIRMAPPAKGCIS